MNIVKNSSSDLGEPLYLTKYIENGDIETAQKLALVTHPDMPVKSYAGYFTVNKMYNSNMFFWYFPAKTNSENAPVVLYLPGTSGASSLFCTFIENGPYIITGSKELIPNEYSWNVNHHLIYIENPVGAGFSFTDSEDGFSRNQVEVSQNLLTTLQQFFVLFPNLQENEFFATGHTYAGKYVPALGCAIHQDSKRESVDPMKPKINLKGMALQYAIIAHYYQSTNGADFMHQVGLVDSNGHKLLVEQQNKMMTYIENRDFEAANYQRGELYKLADDLCGHVSLEPHPKFDDNVVAINAFIEDPKTRRALHVGSNTLNGFSSVEKYIIRDIMDSTIDLVEELLQHYKLMLYNGQLHSMFSYPSLENLVNHLKFDGMDEYKTAKRHIWRVDNEIAGYAKQAGNLTEVLVRNSGAYIAFDQPKWVLDMLSRFTHHKSFN